MDLEGPCWHEFWISNKYATLSQTTKWRDTIVNLQTKYPETNGKYVIWEENNAGSEEPTDWTRSMSNVIRTGITQNIKGCLKAGNWNGMSDLLTTTRRLNQQNGAIRTPIWWVYYMFSQLSGHYVGVTTSAGEDFTACASMDTNESKIIIAKSTTAGTINVNLNNQPYLDQNLRIDLYTITSSENNGLTYQSSIIPSSTKNITFSINNAAANESWLVVLKRTASAPNFFHPISPDDGEVAAAKPTLTWSAAQGATSYTVKVSSNKDLSNPVVNQTGITSTSYTVATPLDNGQKYYWSVTAVNSSGSRTVSNNAVYSLIVIMKRTISVLFAALLICTLAACSNQTIEPSGPPVSPPATSNPAVTPDSSTPEPTPEREPYAALDIFEAEFNLFDMVGPTTVFEARFEKDVAKLEGKNPFTLSMTSSAVYACIAFQADVAGLGLDDGGKAELVEAYRNNDGFLEFTGADGRIVTIRQANPDDIFLNIC